MNYNSSLIYEFNNIFDNIEEIKTDELEVILKSVSKFRNDMQLEIYDRTGYYE